MRRLLLILAALACTGAGPASTQPADNVIERDGVRMEVHREVAGTPDASGWFTARSSGLGYTVTLPRPFNDATVTALATDGVRVHTHVVGTTTEAAVKFAAVAIVREDRKLIPGGGAAIADGFAQKGQLRHKADVRMGDLAALELDVHVAGRAMRCRVFERDAVLYQVMVEYPLAEWRSVAHDAERFFQSFRFPRPARPTTAATTTTTASP
jgi:hypothetical protein